MRKKINKMVHSIRWLVVFFSRTVGGVKIKHAELKGHTQRSNKHYDGSDVTVM